jgi:hypothetical protein
MTTVQEIKLNMYLSIRNFIISNESLTKDLPNFSANYAILLDTISQIQAIGEKQKADKTGLAIEKNKLKNMLITIAADYSRKITAFAKFSNNETLLKETKFTISDLKKMTDVALKDYLEIIYGKAETIIRNLAEYGITPEKQKVFVETINAYNASLSMPRTGIAEKSRATQKLTELFDIADGALENMDYAVGIIQLTQTDFFNGYRSSRKRVATSNRNMALRAKATDNSTGEPVRGVLFTLGPTGKRVLFQVAMVRYQK